MARTSTAACSTGSAPRSSSASRRRCWRRTSGGRGWRRTPGAPCSCSGSRRCCLWTAAGRIARRISRPIYELTRAAQELGQGNLAARASLGRESLDEIGVLSSSFNDMAVRLERQLTEQRELLAAVSHELRTPLARIRLLVEIARQSNGALPNGASATVPPATLDDIEREAIEIDTLVGELLASARLEFQAVTRKPLEAGEAARRALERAGEDAGKLALPAAPLPFVADPTLLARALANLIDNARKHGGGLDGIAVRARRRHGRVRGERSRARVSRPATRRASSTASTAATATPGTMARWAGPGARPSHRGRARRPR